MSESRVIEENCEGTATVAGEGARVPSNELCAEPR